MRNLSFQNYLCVGLVLLPVTSSLLGAVLPDVAKLPPPATMAVDFVKDIEPILQKACVECHGPEKQKGGLRLDVNKLALTGGENHAPNIIPGKSAESPLIHFVSGLDEDMMMPPKAKPLTKEQIGLLRAWIDQGAVWPDSANAKLAKNDPKDWWSLKPLVSPVVPARFEGLSPVDSFVRAKLAESGLQPSSEADRRTLIRRLSLVLVGLPPAPEEVESFVGDPDPKAYERLVEKLLASPHFGERWAQHWLDIVRFAESNGSESNLYRRSAWPYRDYVVRAFNQDKPINQFIREQIAGDVMGVDEATGFLVAGPYTTPDTVGKEEQAIKQARADQLEEIIQSVSASLLGVTMGCARCHNHKFDPIQQKDYYALSAVFQGVQFGHREWSSHQPSGGEGVAEKVARVSQVRGELLALNGNWTEEGPSYLETFFKPVKSRSLRITFPAGAMAMVDEVRIFGSENSEKNLALSANGGVASTNKKKDDGVRPVSNVNDGIMDRFHDWRAGGGKEGGDGTWLQIDLPAEASLERLELSSDRDTLETTDYLTGLSLGPQRFRVEVQQTDGQWKEVAAVDLTATGRTALSAEVRSGLAEIKALKEDLATRNPRLVFAGKFTQPKPTFLLGRGDPMNPREEVKPNALSMFGSDLGLDTGSDDRSRRVAFAEWISDPVRNPLTPRVMANRLWLHVFGRGIVETPGDFGRAGALPSNPILLDWLASELVAGGWSAKAIIRQLVKSAAFKQMNVPNAEAQKVDADARLLWRFPPHRVEAEVLRDATLKVAGTLDEATGGPGFRIHADRKRFEGWKVTDNAGPGTWRRMIYQERIRGVDDQMFTAFDRPECGQVTPKRTSSTTPLQALNLMNGPFIMTQATRLADRLQREVGSDVGAQIQRAFLLVFGRGPSQQEQSDAQRLVAATGLETLGRALLNSNEFVFIQ